VAAAIRPGAASALNPILRHVRAEPSRTWSIIITVYGDAIVPRGGAVWLGTLLEIFRGMGISDGVVRTAMSRLASDGWLKRTRVGRNSYYRLTEKGYATFRAAEQQIYHFRRPEWRGYYEMFLGEMKARDRQLLADSGFGSPGANIWLAPGGADIPIKARPLRTHGDEQANRELAAASWPLADIADGYGRFIKAFAPLQAALAGTMALSPLDALVARVLIVHEFRRIVLREPMLPRALLPPAWPGDEAGRLCQALYRLLLGPSERWLDAHAVDETGANPPCTIDLRVRFQ
jgi:phenylacetic acid degradation operon negative regulatory protein